MSNTIDNHIEFVGTNSQIQELLAFLIHTKSNIQTNEMVSMTGDINVDITTNGVLALTFMTENSPADLLVSAIHDKFPKLKIEGGFHFDNQTTLWKDELGLEEVKNEQNN
tara:strand:+ start:354 stop:683 length:330 start_codon:yes stop_codon:yes gene_type:complete